MPLSSDNRIMALQLLAECGRVSRQGLLDIMPYSYRNSSVVLKKLNDDHVVSLSGQPRKTSYTLLAKGRDELSRLNPQRYTPELFELNNLLKETLFVDGAHRPSDAVKTRLLSLDSSHIEFVQECLSENTTHVKNIKAYLLTCLWRAPETMNHRYMMLVNHHLNGGADRK